MRSATWVLVLIFAMLLRTVVPAAADAAARSISSQSITLTRPGERDIPLRVTWPVGDAKLPVLIWCHGALGSKDGYQPLVTHWASRGYFVIQPTFGDSMSLMSQEDRARAAVNPAAAVNSPLVTQSWDDRPREVSAVLDALEAVASQVPAIRGRVDGQRIAVGGHSYGAHTTMLLAGMELRGARNMAFADERIQAFIVISPQGPKGAITEQSYAKLAGPMLMITGDHDGTPQRGLEDAGGAWRRIAFDQGPADGQHWLLWVHGAHHGFGGISGDYRGPGAGPTDAGQVQLVRDYTTALLDAFLLADAPARATLDKTGPIAGGKAQLEHR